MLTGGTIGLLAQMADVHLMKAVFPEIDDGQAARDRLPIAAEDFDCLSGLDGGNHADDGPENAGRLASDRAARWRAFRYEAA